MKRKSIKIRGLNISYLDNEKEGQSLICLHGHYGMSSMFKFVESFFEGRIIIPDQRGHGFSSKANSYKRYDYIEDLREIIDKMNLKEPILLGHSLGGVNAYQYASKYRNVKKIIVEDIGTEIPSTPIFFSKLPESFNSIWDVNDLFIKHGRPLGPYEMSVLAMGFNIIGHQLHHFNIIKERYYPLENKN